MDKLRPNYKFDQLQAWLVLSKFLQINQHLPKPEDRPKIVEEAINVLHYSINIEIEGEYECDKEGNQISDPEIIITLAECQSKEWDQELKEAFDELNKIFPLSKERKIRIKNFSFSNFKPMQRRYEYEEVLEEENEITQYKGYFTAEKWMSRENIQFGIAQIFCPPGYNFQDKEHSFHFEENSNILFTFRYSRR